MLAACACQASCPLPTCCSLDMVSYHSCLQATFGRGAWAGDGRLEMNHQSVLTPDNSGPVLRWASFTTHHKHNQNPGSVCTAHCLQIVCQSADWLQSTLVSTDTSKEQALFAGQQLGSAAVMVACTKQQAASLTFFLLCPCTLYSIAQAFGIVAPCMRCPLTTIAVTMQVNGGKPHSRFQGA